MRPGDRRRFRLSVFAAAVFAALLAAGWQVAAAGDDVARVIENLRYGRNIKVRVQAASVLARLRDRRVVPELGRAATNDRQSAVRIYVLRLLANAPGGEGDDEGARTAIKRALSDRRGDVRAQAQRSLAELDRRRGGAGVGAGGPPPGQPQELLVAVRGMGDRTGKAGPAVKSALRAAILASLARTKGIRVTEGNDAAAAYAIDGSIAKLALVTTGTEVQSTCAVELVVSRPPRGIVLIASGEATVIESRVGFRPEKRAAMEGDAIEHAVRGAHENLAQFFAKAQGH